MPGTASQDYYNTYYSNNFPQPGAASSLQRSHLQTAAANAPNTAGTGANPDSQTLGDVSEPPMVDGPSAKRYQTSAIQQYQNQMQMSYSGGNMPLSGPTSLRGSHSTSGQRTVHKTNVLTGAASTSY